MRGLILPRGPIYPVVLLALVGLPVASFRWVMQAHDTLAPTPPTSPPLSAPPATPTTPTAPPRPPPTGPARNCTAEEGPLDGKGFELRAQEVCQFLRASPMPGKEPPRGITLIVTTYKAHRTLSNTLLTWKDTGLLDHIHEVIFHVNKCTCAEVSLIHSLMADTAPRYRFICVKGNRLHTHAILVSVAEVRTPYLIFMENDRPTLRHTNETREEAMVRIRKTISVGLDVVSRKETPYLLLHRFALSVHEERLVAAHRKGLLRELPIDVTRPHQHKGDITDCWPLCVDAVQDTQAYMRKSCSKPAGPCASYVCNELARWLSPARDSDPQLRALMCQGVFVRNLPIPKWFNDSRLRYLRWDSPTDPFVICTRSCHFVNGPQLVQTRWYREVIGEAMCNAPAKSGMVYSSSRPHFSRYGRRMEDFLMKKLTGHVECQIEPITEHIELEDFSFERLAKAGNK